MATVPAPKWALIRSASSRSRSSPSQTRLGRASARLAFLAGLAAGLVGAGAASAFVAGGAASLRDLARIRSILLGPLAAAGAGEVAGSPSVEASGSGWGAGILAGLTR